LKTHFTFRNLFPENCAVYETVEKYGRAKQDKDDSIIWRMRIPCWITNTYVFSTTTMGTQTHLSVTFKRTLPALFDTTDRQTDVLSLNS